MRDIRMLYFEADLSMETRLTVFLDILGFTNAVGSLDENELLKLISSFYFYEKSSSENRSIDDEISFEFMKAEQATFFSDCLVISTEPQYVGNLIVSISNLTGGFMRHGYFLRGGVCVGDLYHKDNIVFGPALNNAYEIESKISVNPRVVVTSEVYELCKKYCVSPVSECDYRNLSGIKKVNENCKPLRRIKLDEDGKAYVNPFPLSLPLNLWKSVGVRNTTDLMIFLHNVIESRLTEYGSTAKVRDKYVWLAKKYNEEYRLHNDFKQIQI